jgi:hypothetical protein
VLGKGRVVMEGASDGLRDRPELLESYLGGGDSSGDGVPADRGATSP